METVKIKEESILIEVSTWYRGKTNGYVVERKEILSILDKSGQAVAARWEAEWIEIAPGMEMRGEIHWLASPPPNSRRQR